MYLRYLGIGIGEFTQDFGVFLINDVAIEFHDWLFHYYPLFTGIRPLTSLLSQPRQHQRRIIEATTTFILQ